MNQIRRARTIYLTDGQFAALQADPRFAPLFRHGGDTEADEGLGNHRN